MQERIVETQGQLHYEWEHLKRKLKARSPDQLLKIEKIVAPDPHPLFEIVPGEIRAWEKKAEPKH